MAEHSRSSLAQFLRGIGAAVGKERLNTLPLAESIQPVLVVDDASQLATPLPVPRGWIEIVAGAGGAGTYTEHKIVARGRGLWVNSLYTAIANVSLRLYLEDQGAPLATAVTPVAALDGPFESSFSHDNSLAVAPAAPDLFVSILARNSFSLGIFLSPGQSIRAANATANAALTLGWFFQEVPTRPTQE